MSKKSLPVMVVTFAAALAVLGSCASAQAAQRDPRLGAVKSFAFAIGDEKLATDVHTRLAGYDLVIVDGEGVTAKQVEAMHANGSIVLGYLDVGTIEKGRGWYKSAKEYKLEFWPDWGEWYAKVSSPGFRNLIADRVAPKLLGKGLDGLFLDNVDMIETHAKQKAGMRALVKRLAKRAHARGGFLFAQNGASSIGPSLRYLDGWNREDVGFTYDFEKRKYERLPAGDIEQAQTELRKIRSRGLLTTSTSYTDGSPAQAEAAVQLACAAGAVPFVSNILLTRIDAPRTCS